MLRHFRRDSGSALIELALIAPLLLFILICSAELGRIAYAAIEVSDAAHAGALYGSQNTQTAFGGVAGSPTAAIENAAKADFMSEYATSPLTFPTAPTQACVCETNYANGNTPTFNPTTGTTSCSSATITGCTTTSSTETQSVLQYVVVNTQAKVKTMFTYNWNGRGLPSTFTVSGTSTIRVLQN